MDATVLDTKDAENCKATKNNDYLKTKHGRNKSGKIIHIDQLSIEQKGLKCNMACQHCGVALVACIGTVRKPYFRHSPKSERQCDRESYNKSLVHNLAIQILMRSYYIRVPETSFQYGNSPKYIVEQERYVYMNYVTTGKKVGNIIPDIIVGLEDKTEMFIEIHVTHKVDAQKLEKIRELRISVIEIDLSKLKINEDTIEQELEDILLKGVAHKTWLYNVKHAEYEHKFISPDVLKISVSKFYNDNNLLVMGCPIEKRGETQTNSKYAYITDCKKCVHLCKMSIQKGTTEGSMGSLVCRANKSITSVYEMDMPLDAFREQSNERLAVSKEQFELWIKRETDNLKCASCGGKLIKAGTKFVCENRMISAAELETRIPEPVEVCKDCGYLIEKAKLTTEENIIIIKEIGKEKLCEAHVRVKGIKRTENGITTEIFIVRENPICSFSVPIDEAGNKVYPKIIKH